ncbi:hypothetical protein QFC21_006431 [Naganishia friedmannii]|uniref:Uncharacterized protein n=1 Tax=Naganishia friedmannii TaxID=89922 RepID=A0ACC2V412_9TREE|nr:hypothetical protein QFC21_006431 [Naganishia friedmannii]
MLSGLGGLDRFFWRWRTGKDCLRSFPTNTDVNNGSKVSLTANLKNFPTKETFEELRLYAALEAKNSRVSSQVELSLQNLANFEKHVSAYGVKVVQGKGQIVAQLELLEKVESDRLTAKDRKELTIASEALRHFRAQFGVLGGKEGGVNFLERVCEATLTGAEIVDAHNKIQDLLSKYKAEDPGRKSIEPPFTIRDWRTFSKTCADMQMLLTEILAGPIIASKDDGLDEDWIEVDTEGSCRALTDTRGRRTETGNSANSASAFETKEEVPSWADSTLAALSKAWSRQSVSNAAAALTALSKPGSSTGG